MIDTAIIGGSGLTSLDSLEITKREVVHTPFGEPSGALIYGELGGRDVVFLARHGYGHTIPPHKINYRANIWALKEVGAEKVVSIAAVGGVKENTCPGMLVIPDQLIDYTWSRENTYFEEDLSHVTHVDFTYPYTESLRQILISGCKTADIKVVKGGVYGAVQGPRLESAAEINRMERDGCTIVGMTGMPEAALARELGLQYANCSVVANYAAGRGTQDVIEMSDIEKVLVSGMDKVKLLLQNVLPNL